MFPRRVLSLLRSPACRFKVAFGSPTRQVQHERDTFYKRRMYRYGFCQTRLGKLGPLNPDITEICDYPRASLKQARLQATSTHV